MKGKRIEIAFISKTYRALTQSLQPDASKIVIIPLENGMRSEAEIHSSDKKGELITFAGHCSFRGKIIGQCSPEEGWIETVDSVASSN